jgi:hypothetical protein
LGRGTTGSEFRSRRPKERHAQSLLKLDDEIIEVEERDAIRVSPDVTRAFEAGGAGLEVIVFGPRHEGDGKIVPGWWSD